MRHLSAGQQCEHVDTRFIDGAFTKIPCQVKHLSRVDGKPQQLVPCKDGRSVRFMCLKHAGPIVGLSRRPVKNKPAPEEQLKLDFLGGDDVEN